MRNRSFFSKECILAVDPVDNSDNRFIFVIIAKVVWQSQTSLRFSEMPSSQETLIQFYFLKKMDLLRNRVTLKRFLTQLFKKEKRNLVRLNYIFCSDSYLLNINKRYLSHNYFTDIITFPLSDPTQPIIADIYISVDRVRANAVTFRSSIKQELHRVIFHGALHLCGYNDKSKSESTEIRKKENTYLSLYLDHFVPRETPT